MGIRAKQFETGDRVAHSAKVAYQHGSKSVALWSGIQSADADAFTGTIVAADNDVLTHWMVKVDDGEAGGRCAGETRSFTSDSLVRIEE